MYFRVAVVFTGLWLSAFGTYYAMFSHLFRRMTPNELGDLLSGWFAPLAAVWVGVAVVLQHQQLEAQREDLKHTSEALRMQAEEFQRSVNQLERNAIVSRLERLSDRLFYAMRRIARAAETCFLQSPSSREQSASVSTVLGRHTKYAELGRGNELEKAVKDFSSGLGQMTQKVDRGWVFDGDPGVVEEICAELGGLGRLVSEMERLMTTPGDDGGLGIPSTQELKAFREVITRSADSLGGLLHDVAELDGDGI